ncbi:NUDIX hydrolase [Sedimenticola sp.]|uniref:NUDIX hydrolase n=1 Tax=Sedimenticola sp. TaxID=1940285 RepID=UPI003D109378
MIWTPHTTVASIIEDDGRFLMVEEMTRDGKTVFNQPAGHLEEAESLLEAVIRETREETRWGFRPHALIGIYRWQVPPAETTYLRFCFQGICHDHQPELSLDEGILRAVWMSRDELAANPEQLRSPMVLRCIDDYLAGHRYPLELISDIK